MCPACLTSLALIAGGVGSAGGVAAALVRKIRSDRPGRTNPSPKKAESAAMMEKNHGTQHEE